MPKGLAALLAPLPVEHFEADFRGVRPLHAPAGVRAPLELADLDALVSATDLRSIDARHPPIRAVRPHYERVTASLCGEDGFADLGRVQAAFREGCTITLTEVDRRVPAVGAFCAGLMDGPASAANLYWTPALAQGFEAHADVRDAFFLQLHGAKRWLLLGPKGERQDLVLRDGELLYVPRGWVHEGRAGEEPSLHLTVPVGPSSHPRPAPSSRVEGWNPPLTAQTLVRRPPDAMLRLVRDAAGVHVCRVSASLRVPAWAEPALAVALEGAPVCAAALPVPEEQQLPLVRRLLAEGLLERAP